MARSLFFRACRGEPVERPPVWLMRQAGRYLPEYRAVREKAGSFLALCRTPDLAAEATLQPIRRFGFDAAIVFSDILIPAAAMGAEVRFAEKEGPRIENPVRSDADARALCEPDPREACPFLYETIRIVRRELGALGAPALIGFAAAPFTLASYLVEGGTSRGFEMSRAFLLREERAREELFAKIVRFSARYLAAQVEAGAEALQLFDTWAGLLAPEEFRALALEPAAALLQALRREIGPEVAVIYFVNGVAGALGEIAGRPEFGVLSVDWRVDLAEVRRRLGPGIALQGNLDPATLFAGPKIAAEKTRALIDRLSGRAHIVNLGHGVLPGTPIESVEAVVEAVKTWKPAR
jgi:uroporphyrinogen decarboxylase